MLRRGRRHPRRPPSRLIPKPLVLWVVVFSISLAVGSRANAYVYWGGAATIGRAYLDGSQIQPGFVGGLGSVSYVAVDSRHIYWVDGDAIGRANLDGTDVHQRFIAVPRIMPGADIEQEQFGLAVDGGHIYWASEARTTTALLGGAIGRAKLDGTDVQGRFITPPGGVQSVAVDSRHVYWVNVNTMSSPTISIGRANVDGSDVRQDFIPTAASELTVGGGYIYWTEIAGGGMGFPSSGTIARAKVDGSNIENNLISLGTFYLLPTALAVDDTHIYWANNEGHAIGRANLDGAGVQRTFIMAGRPPLGVAVDAAELRPTRVKVSCSPATVIAERPSACTAMVTDITGNPSTPTGTVAFRGTAGNFSSTSCTLSGSRASSSCQVQYTPAATPGGARTITARYGGDQTHAAISASTTITVLAARSVLTNVSQSARRWRKGNTLPHYATARPPVGTDFRFTRDRTARVVFSFAHTVTGRLVAGRCRAQTKANRSRPRCRRTAIAAMLRHIAHAGKNSLHFEGRINQRRWLAPGSYMLTITAIAHGHRSKPATLRFTILR